MTKPMRDQDSEAPEPAVSDTDPAFSAEVDDAIDVGANKQTLNDYEVQIDDLRDQLMRALAETENVRKRAQRDVEETNKYAITGFARGLVSVLENLQRATYSIPEQQRAVDPTLKTLADGVEMTMRELLSVFEKYGIRRIEPVGEKFDHNFHQAMTQIPDETAEPGTILQVFQAGYVIHDRLLQPALVAVATRGNSAGQVDTKA